MRDERWVNRFLYAWNNSLFYDPVDVVYVPRSDHFLSDLDDETRQRFVRAGIWWGYQPRRTLPVQGWKIHVSATRRDVRETAATTIRYLVGRDIHFKIALDINIFEMLNSKGMSRGSAGKFITIYPADDAEFRQCLDDLATLLEGASGPYVLSDLRYKESKALYFRYGQFRDTHSIDAMGRRVPTIVAPDGQRVPDNRLPFFVKPPWVSWPFDDWPQPGPDAIGLLDGRFRVTEAITFSNSGGIYKAEDVTDGDRVVILKEARPDTNPNPREDHDAVDILRREWEFLTRLAGVGLFPQPIGFFQQWEHYFIAEEFVEGTDIRAILFEHNPLVRVRFDASDSRHFLGIFLKIFKGFAVAIRAAHEHNIVLGDLTATNLLVQPETYAVKIIDLESCRLAESGEADRHLERPVDLYTPGFSRARGVGRRSTTADDLYGLATTMAYLIFPVAAMSFLREDVFDVFRHYVDELGWPGEIHDLIKGLSEGTTTLEMAIKAVSDVDPLLERVEVPVRQPLDAAELRLPDVMAGLAAFVTESAAADRASLFPVDPFAHITNPLSLGFGAAGVLYALNASGQPVQPEWLQWLRDKVAALDVGEHSAGLMNGLAGIAWALDGLGLRAESDHLIELANRLGESTNDYTFYYGLAGLGMTNLRFYTRRNSPQYLETAQLCAKELCSRAQRDSSQVYWLNDFSGNGPLTGLGFGQAGPALFLLRMYQLTKDESYLRVGEGALGWELAHAVDWLDDSITFRHEGTLEPYLEVGSAGVAQVLLRYRDLGTAQRVLRATRLPHSVLPGYIFGMSGIIDAMLDAATILDDPSYRSLALRQFDYIKKVFIFEPGRQPGAPPHAGGVVPLAVPGEGLLRCACDLATGSAGVLRIAHRLHAGGPAEFLLDEIAL